ncbi:MAG: hypothetical protein HZB26_09160 [Candidatus Hydrogenedentes bacterium]|nr:hypothetical protein [Candidatus Hydrogenedentota bacterium]
MTDLDEKTLGVLEALCRKTLRAHGLGAGAHDALYDRMRETLLIYLNGKVPVTPEEALLLVQEAYSDAASVEDLRAFAAARPRDTISLGRRLAVAFAAALAVNTAGKLVLALLLALLAGSMPPDSHAPGRVSAPFDFASFAIHVAVWPALAVVFGLVMFRWQRRLAAGARVYLVHCPAEHLAVIAVVLVAAYALTPLAPLTGAIAGARVTTLSLQSMVTGVIWYVVWLWWCDQLAGNPKAIISALGVQIGWATVLSVSGIGGLVLLNLSGGLESASLWHLSFSPLRVSHINPVLVAVLTHQLTAAVIAGVLYVVAVIASPKRTP